MSEKLSEEEIKNIAAQLRCPEGKMGIKVANTMNQTNIGMTQAGIEALKIKENDDFLEIGHGNAAHLEEILNAAHNVTYRGLDISEAMHREAQKINSGFIETGRASFYERNISGSENRRVFCDWFCGKGVYGETSGHKTRLRIV